MTDNALDLAIEGTGFSNALPDDRVHIHVMEHFQEIQKEHW